MITIINHERAKTNITKNKTTRTQGDAADAEMQSTGVPSTWQGTGQHSKEQRLGLRKYGSHFNPQTMHPEDAYSLAVFLQSACSDTHSRTLPRGYKFIRVGTIRTPHCPHHLNRNIIFRITYKKPNTSRYAQGVRCADGVSLTQEEHYSIGVCFNFFFSIHALLLLYIALRHEARRESR